jgi:hypothetical protein
MMDLCVLPASLIPFISVYTYELPVNVHSDDNIDDGPFSSRLPESVRLNRVRRAIPSPGSVPVCQDEEGFVQSITPVARACMYDTAQR